MTSKLSTVVGAVIGVTILVAACSRTPPCAFPPLADDATNPEPSPLVSYAPSQRAGSAFTVLVPRLTSPLGFQFGDLVYEMANQPMRKQSEPAATPLAGRALAEHWRRTVAIVRGAFVLRDSLYSQQEQLRGADDAAPYAPMLPPSWIATAVADVARSVPLRALCAPPIEDDAAWSALSPDDLFGSFPRSPMLARLARARPGADGTAPLADDVRGARGMLRALAKEVAALARAAPGGPDAVARAGAERVSRGDRRFFGDALRRSKVIPILVENPTAKEQREGKGFVAPGQVTPLRWRRLTRDRLLERRLQDGDIAIERYDLRKTRERERAFEMLAALLGKDSPAQATVWLWIEAGDRPLAELCTDREAREIRKLRSRLAAIGAEPSRLSVVRKPDISLPPQNPAAEHALRAALGRCEALGVFLPVLRSAAELRPWIGSTSK